MDEVITLNNLAVYCLKKGDYRTALDTLKRAAEIMYKVTREINDFGYATGDLDKRQDQACEHLYQSLFTEKTKGGHVLPVADNCFVQDTPFFLSSLPSNKAGCTIVSAFVLFNMGLTYHLSTLQCLSIEGAAGCASSLYSMACSLASRSNVRDYLPQLVLACLNNAGCLHFDLGDFKTSRRTFDELSQYIMSLNEGSNTDVTTMEKNEIMLNAMLLRDPHAAPAA